MKYIKVIHLILLLAVVSSVSESHAQNSIVLDKVIGVIGDEIATKSELEGKFTTYAAQGMEVTDGSRCQVLEDILYAKMLLNHAKLDSIEVSESQVEAEMDRRLRYYISQFGSEKAMENYYKKPLSKIKDELRSSMREQMLIQGMQSEITQDAKVTPAEVEAYFKNIPEDSLPLIDAEVELAHIVVYAPSSNKSIQSVKDKLNEYRDRILEGERFSTLAVLYSEDEGSATQGGEIGFVGKAEVAPEFGAAAFQLKPGQVSPIVKTDFGYHIIQMIERRGTKVNVRHILMKPKIDREAMEKAKITLDSIVAKIDSGKISFEEAAKKYSDDKESKKNGGIIVNPRNASSMTPMDELDPSLFFVIDKLEEGDISQPTELNDPRSKPGYRVVKLNKRTKPHKANLSQDYQKVKQAALSEKQQEALQEWMEKRVKDTYIKLDKKYTKGCEFMQPWIENSK